MGHIIFWAIIRTAVLIPSLWVMFSFVENKYWWWLVVVSVSAIIIYPITVQYRIFYDANKEIIEQTLCTSCKHFDKTAVLCMKLDKHPTLTVLPCEGLEWEPAGIKNEQKEINT